LSDPLTVRRGDLTLVIMNGTGKRLPAAAGFAGVLAKGLRRNRPRRGPKFSLTLMVVGDREMAKLARRFAGAGGLTDVLAFEDGSADSRTGRVDLGEVVISRDRAVAEAKARGTSAGDEMRLYALHGLLHMLGYDDGSAAQRRRMFAEQAAVVGEFGGDLS